MLALVEQGYAMQGVQEHSVEMTCSGEHDNKAERVVERIPETALSPVDGVHHDRRHFVNAGERLLPTAREELECGEIDELAMDAERSDGLAASHAPDEEHREALREVGEAFLNCLDDPTERLVPETSNEASHVDESATACEPCETKDSRNGLASALDFVCDNLLQLSRTDQIADACESTLTSAQLPSGIAATFSLSTTECLTDDVYSVLSIPMFCSSDCTTWLLNNTYFGKVVEVTISMNPRCAQITFESADAAHLYSGLLRFAGHRIPGFEIYFRPADMVNNAVSQRPGKRHTATRVLVLYDVFNDLVPSLRVSRSANSNFSMDALRTSCLGKMCSVHAMTVRVSRTLFAVCCASIKEAMLILHRLQTKNYLVADAGISDVSYGPDPSVLEYEEMEFLPQQFQDSIEQSLRWKLLQALACRATASQSPAVALRIPNEFVGPKIAAMEKPHSRSACKCFRYSPTSPPAPEDFLELVHRNQRSNKGRAEMSALPSNETCSCGLLGIWRGVGKMSFFVPYIPQANRLALYSMVHIRNGTHASALATLSRAQNLAYFGHTTQETSLTEVTEYLSRCCLGTRAPSSPAVAKRQLEHRSVEEEQARKRVLATLTLRNDRLRSSRPYDRDRQRSRSPCQSQDSEVKTEK